MLLINNLLIDKIIACSPNPQFALWYTAIHHHWFTNNQKRDSEHAKGNFDMIYMFTNDIRYE